MVSDLTRHRREFWRHFADRLPELASRMVRGNEHSRWLIVGDRPLVVAHYVANRGVGLFVRGPARERIGHVRDYLFPHRQFLAERLDKPDLRLRTTFLLPDIVRLDMTDRANWDDAVDWFARHSPIYEAVFTELQAQTEPWPDEFPPPGLIPNA